MVEIKGVVGNIYGIHCRPADQIRRSIEGYEGKVEILNGENVSANPHKVLSILSLALVNGDQFTVRVEGPNEQEVATKLATLLQSPFEFQK